MAGLRHALAMAIPLLAVCGVIPILNDEPQSDDRAAKTIIPSAIAVQPLLGGKPALNVGFTLPDESTQVITFVERPLGLDFDKRVPIVIKRGPREGWTMISVDGEDVTGKDFEYIYGVLKTKTGSLEVPPPVEQKKAARTSVADEDVNAIQLRATLAKSSPGEEQIKDLACSTEEEAETREELAKRMKNLESLAARQRVKAAKLFKEVAGDAATLDTGVPIKGADLQGRVEAMERSFEAHRLVADELQAAAKLELRNLASQEVLPERCKAPKTCECP